MQPTSYLKSQNNSNVFNFGIILSGSKVTNAIGNLINSSIPTVQADDKPKYDYNHPYCHYYQLNNNICSTKQPSCTSDNVFKELKKYPAPGWDGSKSVDNGEISTIEPYGIDGKVIHVVDGFADLDRSIKASFEEKYSK